MPSFTYLPDYGIAKKSKPIVQSVKFGDGYEQRNAFGLNTNPKNWDVQFSSRDQTEADAIEAFLDTQGGVQSFSWTPPGALSPSNFICREWTKTQDNPGLYTISATFEQVFDP